jgi:hypothetical protein
MSLEDTEHCRYEPSTGCDDPLRSCSIIGIPSAKFFAESSDQFSF